MASVRPASACLLGLVVFVLGSKALLGAGEPPVPLSKNHEITLYAVGIAAVAVIWALVQYQEVIQTLLMGIRAWPCSGYVVFQALGSEPNARDRIFAILFLIALNPIFWALFEQAGGR